MKRNEKKRKENLMPFPARACRVLFLVTEEFRLIACC